MSNYTQFHSTVYTVLYSRPTKSLVRQHVCKESSAFNPLHAGEEAAPAHCYLSLQGRSLAVWSNELLGSAIVAQVMQDKENTHTFLLMVLLQAIVCLLGSDSRSDQMRGSTKVCSQNERDTEDRYPVLLLT